MTTRVTRHLRLAAAALAGGLTLAACSGTPEVEPLPQIEESSLPAPSAKLSSFYKQTIDWEKCGSGECGTVEVPLDYAKPSGRTLKIKVGRLKARGADPVGALLVNPGGPGASGVSLALSAAQWSPAIRKGFDVVGFDPRGVGESEPITCLSDEEFDAYIGEVDPSPDTLAEVRQGRQASRAFFKACMEEDAELATHLSTEEVARDMDIVRAALQERQVNYLGYSYGTYLGATYADLFPKRVGRMVLDGAVDPSLTNAEFSVGQATGFERAVTAYVSDCVADSDCYLGNDVDAAKQQIASFLKSLDQKPIPGSDERDLSEGWAIYGLVQPFYLEALWGVLDVILEDGLAGDGAGLMEMADAYHSRSNGEYADNSSQVISLVNCTDHGDVSPPAQLRAERRQVEAAAPTLGNFFSAGLDFCKYWSFRSGKGPIVRDAAGSAPILVIGTTRDPATPYEWAEGLAKQLENGVLLSRDGDGHTAYGSGNSCIDDAVESYLVAGQVPDDGKEC